MTSTTKPYAYVEGLNFDTIDADAKPNHLILHVHYGQKQAQIELPVGELQHAQEPGTEVYRRDLAELLEALQEVVASPQGILWPPRR